MRVSLPATLPALTALKERGELVPDGEAHAVTPALREWYAEGDEEELEYVAFTRAAQAALRLLRRAPGAPRRRVVVSADIPAGQLTEIERELGSSAVRLRAAVPPGAVAAIPGADSDAGAGVEAACPVVEEALAA